MLPRVYWMSSSEDVTDVRIYLGFYRASFLCLCTDKSTVGILRSYLVVPGRCGLVNLLGGFCATSRNYSFSVFNNRVLPLGDAQTHPFSCTCLHRMYYSGLFASRFLQWPGSASGLSGLLTTVYEYSAFQRYPVYVCYPGIIINKALF